MSTLKEERLARRITMRVMAEEAGLTLTRYAAIENNYDEPNEAEARAISFVLQGTPLARTQQGSERALTAEQRKLARWNADARGKAEGGQS